MAVSRNGLLPLAHFKGTGYPDFPEGDPSNLKLDELIALLAKHRERMESRGLNPAMLVDKLRPYTQRIWRNFTLAKKQRFKRDYGTRWGIVRHRIAKSIHRQLTAAMESGRLSIVKGSIGGISADESGLAVAVRQRDGDAIALRGGAVINCTGPAEGYKEDRSFLYRNLFGRGLAVPDDLNMGIRAFGRVCRDRAGRKAFETLDGPRAAAQGRALGIDRGAGAAQSGFSGGGGDRG